MSKAHGEKGFTLVELLVVIAIIGILMGLLLPALTSARRKAMSARAQSEVKALEAAVKAYYNEYSVFPGRNGQNGDFTQGSGKSSSNAEADNKGLIKTLRSITTTNNSRKILFLETATDAVKDDNMIDPWGNQYRIAMDTDFDNTLENLPDDLGQLASRNVAVWSLGMNGKSGRSFTNDYVVSWK